MQFWVYMLRCSDGSYYTGHTDDLQKRLWEHQQGLAADWTRRRRPVELAWCAAGTSRDEVFAFERRVKTWSRAKKEALIADDWGLVGHFARPPHERPSTRLGTSDSGGALQHTTTSVVPSEVEGRRTEPTTPLPPPFVPSEVEGRSTEPTTPHPPPLVPSEVQGRRSASEPTPPPPASGRGA